jgi:hypothetical protein
MNLAMGQGDSQATPRDATPAPARALRCLTMAHGKAIAIVGAGPAGLAALKAVLDSEQHRAGRWSPLVFEAREELGGIW